MRPRRVSSVQSPEGQQGEQFPQQNRTCQLKYIDRICRQSRPKFSKRMFMQYLRGFSFLYRVSLLVQVRVQLLSLQKFGRLCSVHVHITTFGIDLTQSGN